MASNISSSNNKTSAEVIIDGKVYTIAGYESADYLQRIATYINSKTAEFQKNEGYNRLTTDYRNILMQINIADDYFRLQQQYEDLKEQSRAREKDVYDYKHDLVALQVRYDQDEKKIQQLKDENDDQAKKIIRLETELKTRNEDAQKNRH